MTPLQMAMVAATVANGGVLMEPHVLEPVVAPDGKTVVTTKPDELGARVMPAARRRRSTEMMEAVVDGRHRHRSPDPRDHGRRQDGNRRDRRERRQHDLVHRLRAGRQPADRSRRRRSRTSMASGGDDAAPIAKQIMEALLEGSSNRARGGNRHPDRHALRRPLPHHAQARRRAGWRTSTSPRTRSSAGASRSRSSTTGTRRDDQFVERFRREAKNAAGLSHPNIVSIYDRGEAEGTYYIAMEYLDGRSPEGADRRTRAAPDRRSRSTTTRQILSALGSRTAKGSSTATSSRTT